VIRGRRSLVLKTQWNHELMYDMPLIQPSLYLCHLAMAQI